jgi:hypothetical protein
MRATLVSFILISLLSYRGIAQEVCTIQIPDQTLFADQMLNGDGDLYGLGSWQIHVNVEVIQRELVIRAEIIFSEDANDQTTIMGIKEWSIPIGKVNQENLRLVIPATGHASGKNIGARGTRTWQGFGLIEKVHICTDTFGTDTGKVGGTLVFRPIELTYEVLPAKILPILTW